MFGDQLVNANTLMRNIIQLHHLNVENVVVMAFKATSAALIVTENLKSMKLYMNLKENELSLANQSRRPTCH